MNEYSPKLSPSTKRLLMQISESENPELSFLIRIEGNLNEEQRLQLKPLVIEIRSEAGNIINVTAFLKSVPQLVALKFINYIEISGPMFLEKTPSVP